MTNYTTVSELKSQIGISGSSYDTLLTTLIEAASRQIDRLTGREDSGFVAPAAASTKTYAGTSQRWLWIDECVSVTLVETYDGTEWLAWDASDWVAFSGSPDKPNYSRTPYTGLLITPTSNRTWPSSPMPYVRVTARWGYAAVCPATIKTAVEIQAARWFKRGQSAWADSLASPDLAGALLYRQTLDPDLRAILEEGGFMRVTVAGIRG